MLDIEYSVITSDVIKSFDCISNLDPSDNTFWIRPCIAFNCIVLFICVLLSLPLRAMGCSVIVEFHDHIHLLLF